MLNWRRPAVAVAAISVLTATAVAAGSPVATGDPADGYTFAVIGDIPYGDAQIANFPKVVAQINADPAVKWVDHLGDIKNGSSQCTDAYFAMVRKNFDNFADPLVYTPGDNEWTDCHRANNGGYNPLERLAAVRTTFFPNPGETLGKPTKVRSQADQGLPENVRWQRANVSFAAVHIVGSDNSMAPWTGNTTATPEQAAEVLGRTAGSLQLIHDTFTAAREDKDKAVALMLQADMFDPTVANASFADYYAFKPIVAAIAREAASFDGPVYMFNGDSHVFNADNPLAAGSKWLQFYGVSQAAPNVSRITVDGSDGVNNYLRVTVHSKGQDVLTWTRVPFAS